MHRQIRQENKCAFKYSAVINILCDVITGAVVDVNMKTRPLTHDDRASSCARICGTRKVAAE